MQLICGWRCAFQGGELAQVEVPRHRLDEARHLKEHRIQRVTFDGSTSDDVFEMYDLQHSPDDAAMLDLPPDQACSRCMNSSVSNGRHAAGTKGQ
jgi:hypothetical protein